MQRIMTFEKQRGALPNGILVEDVAGEPTAKLAPERKHFANLLKMVAYKAECSLLRALGR